MDPLPNASTSTPNAPSSSIEAQLHRLVADLDSLGIATQLGGKTVGGVALTRSYYQHALETEGKPNSVEQCQLLISRRVDNELRMCPATTEELEAGSAELPKEAPVLAKLMGPTAVAQFKWGRVPAVVIFGCFVADDAEVAQAEALGIPVSPSMSGPHPEELLTQLEVFYKQYKYPEHKCFWLRDWGFMIFGAELEEALVTFEDTIKPLLITSGEASDQVTAAATPTSPFSITSAFKRLGSMIGRSASEPTEAAASSPCYAAGGGRGTLAAAGAVSEPTSPALVKGDAANPFAAASTTLPDDIRKISTTALRANSDTYRIPSFQTGLKPW